MSLLKRLPGHFLLFTGIVVGGIAALFIYVNYTNIYAWAALAYGVFSAITGVTIVLR